MMKTQTLAVARVAGAGLAAAALSAPLHAEPDCIVGQIDGIEKYGTSNGISAYALGTTACNAGDTILAWIDSGPDAERHPVIAQNVYRLKDGRFEQIGMSWLKHGFCAADSFLCGSCSPAGGCDFLGLGCSDTYWAGLNGNQSSLGPRSEVDPVTGSFDWPHTLPVGSSITRGRIQIAVDDLAPAQNPGAMYFGEGQYIHPDDAAHTPYNNSTWRQINVGSFSGGAYSLSFTGPQNVEEPAIYAWQVHDPEVDIQNVDVDGRFVLASRCSDNGDGTWHYEYAVLNMNSLRAGGTFSVAVPAGATVTNIGFTDIDHHSGEPYDTADWDAVVESGAITWSTVAFAKDENANALRWGTLYNFRFDADVPPGDAEFTLGLHRPGTPESVSGTVCGPGPVDVGPADLDEDGVVGVSDLLELLSVWGPCDGCQADLDSDGSVNVSDLLEMLASWG